MGRNESDRSELDYEKNEDRPSKAKFASVKRALTSANEKVRQKNLLVRFEYNEYMAHHYVYMRHVAEVRELESYTKATKDANWCAAMEEEMHALTENES